MRTFPMYDQIDFLWTLKTEFGAGAASDFGLDSDHPYPILESFLLSELWVRQPGRSRWDLDRNMYECFFRSFIFSTVPDNLFEEVYK